MLPNIDEVIDSWKVTNVHVAEHSGYTSISLQAIADIAGLELQPEVHLEFERPYLGLPHNLLELKHLNIVVVTNLLGENQSSYALIVKENAQGELHAEVETVPGYRWAGYEADEKGRPIALKIIQQLPNFGAEIHPSWRRVAERLWRSR